MSLQRSGERERVDMDSSGQGTKSPSSYKDYFNSSILSDVTIHFGSESSKRTFPGHADILCVRSRWFKNALTGSFRESESRIIDLNGDDTEAVYNMLKFIYGVPIQEFGHELEWQNFTSSVNIWQVADKYDVPELCKGIEQWWSANLPKFIDRFYQKGHRESTLTSNSRERSFTEFVLGMFDLVSMGPQHMKETLLPVMLRASLERDGFFSKQGESLLQDALSINPELAQCMLFYIRHSEHGATPIRNASPYYGDFRHEHGATSIFNAAPYYVGCRHEHGATSICNALAPYSVDCRQEYGATSIRNAAPYYIDCRHCRAGMNITAMALRGLSLSLCPRCRVRYP